jgi:hypothetical protein
VSASIASCSLPTRTSFRADEADALAHDEEDEGAWQRAVEELGDRLSPSAREALESVALARARGYGPVELRRRAGISIPQQRRALEGLRAELGADVRLAR